MKAPKRFEIIIHGDTDIINQLHSSLHGLMYLMERLLCGEEVAESEWKHYGLSVSVDHDTDGGPEE